METDYPWDGDVRVVVERASGEPYAIRLRVPAWARSVTASVNGLPVEGAEDGWLTVERVWAAGDELRLGIPMPVRAHGSHPYLDATRGAVSVARGPLVYCVEQQDCPVPVDDLVVSPERIAGAAVERSRDELPGAVVLRMTAEAAVPPSAELYPELPSERRRPAGRFRWPSSPTSSGATASPRPCAYGSETRDPRVNP
ncbi:hypothetical protein ACFQX6_07105 [Streptosporangium lutulentum]